MFGNSRFFLQIGLKFKCLVSDLHFKYIFEYFIKLTRFKTED
jgi:hypothetical protein